jgi:hypothetical protein
MRESFIGKQGDSVEIPLVQTRKCPCIGNSFPHFSTNTITNAENFSISETSRRIKPEFSDFFGIFSILCCDVKVLSSVFHSFSPCYFLLNTINDQSFSWCKQKISVCVVKKDVKSSSGEQLKKKKKENFLVEKLQVFPPLE